MALVRRIDETDEEYEARKKRVKRSRQGVGNDMFANRGGGGGGGGSSGHCITQGTDGTNYGIKRSLPTPFGSVDPEHTPEGILIYDFYCQTSGEVVLRLGDDGEYEVQGVLALDITYNVDQVVRMVWVDLENMYLATDHDFTAYATAIPVDEEYCVTIERIPVDLPTQPTLLRVGATTDTSITLLWNASTQGTYPIASYNVQAENLLIGTPASNAFTYNDCPANQEISYRVQAVDDRGNMGPWSNTLNYTNVVFDDTPPVITIVGNNPATILQYQTYVDEGATALDDIEGDVTDLIVTTSDVNTDIIGAYTVAYNCTDRSGNVADEKIRNVNVTTTTIQMIETQNGYCEFDEGGSCTTPSLISSTITGEYTTATYNWVVIGATIDGSNTEDYIIVTTPAGNTDVTYTVQLTAIIDGVEYYVENDYTQIKTLAPIRITGISQDVSGSCDPNPPAYDPGIYSGVISDNNTGATFTDLTGGNWNIETTTPTLNNDSFIVGSTEAFEIGLENTWAFNAEILSGSCTIEGYYPGTGTITINHIVVEGINEVKFTTDTAFADIYMIPLNGSEFNINFTEVSIIKGV